MKKQVVSSLLSIASCAFLVNLSKESSMDAKHYPDVNFKGVIQARSGTMLNDVENILIGGKYKQIAVYEKPAKMTDTTKLAFDPSDKKHAITSYLDLAEIKTIRVDNPTIWTYQKEKGYSTIEFIEIVVVSNNAKDPNQSYLIKLRNTITCDEITQAGPIEKVIPLSAITSLTIKDFKAQGADAAEYTCVQECRSACKKR